jgi:hypothetical protein
MDLICIEIYGQRRNTEPLRKQNHKQAGENTFMASHPPTRPRNCIGGISPESTLQFCVVGIALIHAIALPEINIYHSSNITQLVLGTRDFHCQFTVSALAILKGCACSPIIIIIQFWPNNWNYVWRW